MTEFRIPEIEAQIQETIHRRNQEIIDIQKDIAEEEAKLQALKGRTGKKVLQETRDLISSIEYDKSRLVGEQFRKDYYYINGRLKDNRILKTYYPNITAYLQNQFGYAFILKGKNEFFCFMLLTCNSIAHHTNWKLRVVDREQFYKDFGDKLTIVNEEDYSKYKAKLLIKSLENK